MTNTSIGSILLKYPPCLRSNLKELVSNAIGLTKSFIEIKLPPHKLLQNFNINSDNTIFLDIPYAGKTLSIEVTFNNEDLLLPPYFDILNDTFLADPDADLIEKRLPTLKDWSLDNPQSLTNIILQIIDEYRKHQVEKFLQDPQFTLQADEFRALKDDSSLNYDDMELFMGNNVQYIFIPIILDYSHLPEYIHEEYFSDGILENPGEDKAILKICYSTRRNESSLQLSPRLERVFRIYSSLDIPSYDKMKTLGDYVKSVRSSIKNKMCKIQEHFNKKEKFFSLLLSLHHKYILEYDTVNFTTGTFLFVTNSFPYLVKFKLGDRFPNEKPTIILSSVAHKIEKGPIDYAFKNYPYNSDWEVKEIVDRITGHIRMTSHLYKADCLDAVNKM